MIDLPTIWNQAVAGRIAACAAAIAIALSMLALAIMADASGTAGGETAVKSGDVAAKVMISDAQAASGQQLGIAIDFRVAPGWHIYGRPLPEDYTPTSVRFDNDLVASQRINFPKPTPMKFEAIGDTFPVYTGNFKADGTIRLKPKLTPGEHKLAGTISFQECNDLLCKIPQQVRFEVPLRIEPDLPK